MIRFHLLLALLAACALLFSTSCKKDKDDDPAPGNTNNDNKPDTTGNPTNRPRIQLIFALPPDGSTVLDQSQLRIKFRADKAANGPNLVSFNLESANTHSNPNWRSLQGFPVTGLNAPAIEQEIPLRLDFGGSALLSIRLSVTDANNQRADLVLKYTVEERVPPLRYSDIVFNAQGPFFSTASGQRILAAQGQSRARDIDLTHFLSPTSGHNLVSAAARTNSELYGNNTLSWGQNAVEFRTISMTAAEYSGFNDSKALKGLFDSGQPTQVTGGNVPGTRITQNASGGMGGQFKQGSVIAYKTSLGDKYGLIFVKSMTATEAVVEILRER